MARYTYSDEADELEEGGYERSSDTLGADVGIQPGYSAVINSPEFSQALKRQKRGFVIGVVAILAIVVVIAAVVAFSRHGDSATTIGTFVASLIVVFLILGIMFIVRAIKRGVDKDWDGEVLNKATTEKKVRHGSGDDSYYRKHKAFVVEFRTDEGKQKKLTELDRPRFYALVQEGDRVRYHNGLPFPYEKYDKTQDADVVCPFCSELAPITETNCPKCKQPLLR